MYFECVCLRATLMHVCASVSGYCCLFHVTKEGTCTSNVQICALHACIFAFSYVSAAAYHVEYKASNRTSSARQRALDVSASVP